MSNDIINIRVGLWHLHIMRDRPWVRVGRNDYYRGKLGKPGFPYFEVYL